MHRFCLQTRKNCVICFQHLGKKSVDHWHQNPVIWHRGCSLPINNENMKMSLPSHLYDGYLLSSHFILHRVERGSATGGSLVALQSALRFAPFRPDVGETVVGIADQRGTWCLWPGGWRNVCACPGALWRLRTHTDGSNPPPAKVCNKHDGHTLINKPLHIVT